MQLCSSFCRLVLFAHLSWKSHSSLFLFLLYGMGSSCQLAGYETAIEDDIFPLALFLRETSSSGHFFLLCRTRIDNRTTPTQVLRSLGWAPSSSFVLVSPWSCSLDSAGTLGPRLPSRIPIVETLTRAPDGKLCAVVTLK